MALCHSSGSCVSQCQELEKAPLLMLEIVEIIPLLFLSDWRYWWTSIMGLGWKGTSQWIFYFQLALKLLCFLAIKFLVCTPVVCITTLKLVKSKIRFQKEQKTIRFVIHALCRKTRRHKTCLYSRSGKNFFLHVPKIRQPVGSAYAGFH